MQVKVFSGWPANEQTLHSATTEFVMVVVVHCWLFLLPGDDGHQAVSHIQQLMAMCTCMSSLTLSRTERVLPLAHYYDYTAGVHIASRLIILASLLFGSYVCLSVVVVI